MLTDEIVLLFIHCGITSNRHDRCALSFPLVHGVIGVENELFFPGSLFLCLPYDAIPLPLQKKRWWEVRLRSLALPSMRVTWSSETWHTKESSATLSCLVPTCMVNITWQVLNPDKAHRAWRKRGVWWGNLAPNVKATELGRSKTSQSSPKGTWEA